ncbi:M24 family metallopeptidase [Salicibibacter cibi]|uniref:M24 family metallopeptidase n=1 Tax=Salicibibacter cibi TaxID=2743001 RepID=A0A7T6Z8C4_9BACI|nr:M24 family metallopeptidase [Salicibibacter cibi]QQK78743.1 M24 family metallopeptidase [Salicibibacter cibi]
MFITKRTFRFHLSEYRERLYHTKKKMQDKGMDVLLITDPANMNYLTGYDAWTFYVGQIVVVSVDEEEPMWIGRDQDANGAHITAWMNEKNIIPCPEEYYHSDQKHPMDFFAKLVHLMGKSNRTIGVEMDMYYFTAATYEALKRALPSAKLRNANALVNWVRLVKSDQEIAYMRMAATLAENAMSVGIEKIEADVRENDVIAEVYHELIAGTDAFGGDYPAVAPLIPSGDDTSSLHVSWSDRKFHANDFAILKLSGCSARYHAPLSRTIAIGETPEKIKEAGKHCVEGLHAALDTVKPGVTCEEIEYAWRQTAEKHGVLKDTFLGYSIGSNYPPDWGSHTANLRQGDRTVLQPNMTFHMIPRLWIDGSGIEVSETFQVTETGCETLTDFERRLFVK